jgi:hypothetical protein
MLTVWLKPRVAMMMMMLMAIPRGGKKRTAAGGLGSGIRRRETAMMMIDVVAVVRRQRRWAFAAHASPRPVTCSSIVGHTVGVGAPTTLRMITTRNAIIEKVRRGLDAGLASSAGFGAVHTQAS